MDRVSSMLSFVKVVDHGGFSAAARELAVSTSVVTGHVKSIEDRLGVRLLNRTTRKVGLSEAGQTYYERCVQILAEIEQADEAARALQGTPRGTLRLNVSPGVPTLLAASMAEFTTSYPDVAVRLTVTSRMVDLVEEGFDLAIRFKASVDSGLIVRRLAACRPIVCASPDYLARRGRPEHPSDLIHHNCLIYYDASWGKGGKEWHFTGPDGDLHARVAGSMESNSLDALRAAVLLGQGLAILPRSVVARELDSGTLVPVLADFPPAEFPLQALYPNREHLPAKVRRFLDLVARRFSEANSAGAERRSRHIATVDAEPASRAAI